MRLRFINLSEGVRKCVYKLQKIRINAFGKGKKMKKTVSVLLIVLIFCASFAWAEGSYIGNMEVVNCKEWVSLRSEPTTEAERITKVPLGSIVSECYMLENGWVYGLYCGQYGYISADYLFHISADIENGFYAEHDDVVVIGKYESDDNGETYALEAFNENGHTVWAYDVTCGYCTELKLVEIFLGGTQENPMIMAYSASRGLSALNFYTGEYIWNIPITTLDLGGSISYAVDSEGNMYIGGAYGPDPVAISADGEILWQTDFLGTWFWLSEIEIEGDALLCHYDMSNNDLPTDVWINKNTGDFISSEYIIE